MDEAATAAWDLLCRYLVAARCDEKLIDDFMWMDLAVSASGVTVWQFKHRRTRRYLVLDASGHCYFYDGSGRCYRLQELPAELTHVRPVVTT